MTDHGNISDRLRRLAEALKTGWRCCEWHG